MERDGDADGQRRTRQRRLNGSFAFRPGPRAASIDPAFDRTTDAQQCDNVQQRPAGVFGERCVFIHRPQHDLERTAQDHAASRPELGDADPSPRRPLLRPWQPRGRWQRTAASAVRSRGPASREQGSHRDVGSSTLTLTNRDSNVYRCGQRRAPLGMATSSTLYLVAGP